MDEAWWIRQIFERSLAEKANPEAAQAAADVPAEDALGFMTRIFANCGGMLASFTDQQVAEGLIFLGSAGESDWMYHLYDPAIDRQVRYACVRSIEHLYSGCFARRCRNAITHGSSDIGSLNSVCYMWWDVFPSGGMPTTTDAGRRDLDCELIEVMAAALRVEHAACQESVLHGLGHWQSANPNRVHAIIDKWRDSHPHLSPALTAYSGAARSGNVL